MINKELIINDLVENKDHFKEVIKQLKCIETFHNPIFREEIENSFQQTAKWLIVMDIHKRLYLPIEDIICVIEEIPIREYLK